jgi:hypothetical protein
VDVFLSHLYIKRTFYQDRLGTNIGKTPKKTGFPYVGDAEHAILLKACPVRLEKHLVRQRRKGDLIARVLIGRGLIAVVEQARAWDFRSKTVLF